MTRFERKNRKDIKYRFTGPIFDLIDNYIKSKWRINDEEYDYLHDNLSEQELESFILVGENITISKLKIILNRTNELLEIKNNLRSINRDNIIETIIK